MPGYEEGVNYLSQVYKDIASYGPHIPDPLSTLNLLCDCATFSPQGELLNHIITTAWAYEQIARFTPGVSSNVTVRLMASILHDPGKPGVGTERGEKGLKHAHEINYFELHGLTRTKEMIADMNEHPYLSGKVAEKFPALRTLPKNTQQMIVDSIYQHHEKPFPGVDIVSYPREEPRSKMSPDALALQTADKLSGCIQPRYGYRVKPLNELEIVDILAKRYPEQHRDMYTKMIAPIVVRLFPYLAQPLCAEQVIDVLGFGMGIPPRDRPRVGKFNFLPNLLDEIKSDWKVQMRLNHQQNRARYQIIQ